MGANRIFPTNEAQPRVQWTCLGFWSCTRGIFIFLLPSFASLYGRSEDTLQPPTREGNVPSVLFFFYYFCFLKPSHSNCSFKLTSRTANRTKHVQWSDYILYIHTYINGYHPMRYSLRNSFSSNRRSIIQLKTICETMLRTLHPLGDVLCMYFLVLNCIRASL